MPETLSPQSTTAGPLQEKADFGASVDRSATAPAFQLQAIPSFHPAAAPLQRALDGDDLDLMADQVNHGLLGPIVDAQRIFLNLQRLNGDAGLTQSLIAKYQTRHGLALEGHIRSMLSDQEAALALELIGIVDAPRVAMVGNVPTTPDEYKAAALRIHNGLTGAAADKEAVFSTLMPFDRNQGTLTTLKTTYQREHGSALNADISAHLAGTEKAYALYLLNGHPTETARHTNANLDDSGTTDTSAVPGGEVRARTGVKYSPARGGRQRVGGFAMEYEGALADETHWLQFIWREIEVHQADGTVVKLNDRIRTTGGDYQLTTDPAAPSYNTDSASATNPFYEARGFNNRTADATTIFDRPSSADAFVQREFGRGATRVVSRAHFDSFMIRDYMAVHQYSTSVEWNYTSNAVPNNTQTLQNDRAINALPARMRARLIAQYPNYDYIM